MGAGKALGLLAVAGAAALWAAAAVVASNLFEAGMPAVELAEARAVIAVAGFALVPGAWRRPVRGDWKRVAALGITIVAVNVTYYESIARIPVAVALVLQYTAPALVVAWTSVAARRPPSAPVVRALVLASAGVVLVLGVFSRGMDEIDIVGAALALGAAVFFASYAVLAEAVAANYSPQAAMFRAFGVAALVWVGYQATQGLPHDLLLRRHAGAVLFVGLVGTLAPFLLFMWGVQQVQAQRAAIAATLEPVLAAAMAWIWLGQGLSPLQVAGGVVVIAAVVSLQVAPSRGTRSALP